jgi:hypothetical protein
MSLRCASAFVYLAPLRYSFSWSLRCAAAFVYLASLRCARGLRQQGVVLFFALDGMSKLMP